jgi:hypothetical protein
MEIWDYGFAMRKSKLERVQYETELEAKFAVPAAEREGRNFSKLRPRAWQRAKAGDPQYMRGPNGGYQNRVRFGSLPAGMRPIAERELGRLIAQTKARGREITRHKLASLIGNATAIARDCRCTNNMGKRMFRYKMDKLRYEKLRERRASVMAERLAAMQDAGMERGDAET